MTPYESEFTVGQAVAVADRACLEAFMASWKLHHPLARAQLAFAGRTAVVERVTYYHGGDVLYDLSGFPGTWHECCIVRARATDPM